MRSAKEISIKRDELGYYRLSLKNSYGTIINFDTELDDYTYISKLLLTGEIREIYVGASRTVPGQKILIRSIWNDDKRIEVVIKDDMFDELFRQTFLIDEESKMLGLTFC